MSLTILPDLVQGSPEWFDQRRGMVTASEIGTIITASTDPLGVYGKSPDGRRLFTRKDGSIQRAARSLAEGSAAMGIDWMTAWEDVTEAIPPAYTEHIGRQLMTHIGEVAA